MDFLAFPEAGLAAAAVGLLLFLLELRRRRRPGRRAEPPGVEPAKPAAAPAPVEEAPAVSGAARPRAALTRSRETLRARLDDALGQARDPEGVFEALEDAMVGADVGLRTTARILDGVRRRLAGERAEEGAVRAALRAVIEDSLTDGAEPERAAKPWVILVTGVNGVGKTTSIGKLAARFAGEGRRVLLVAADTFRAAAIDQLAVWAERVGVDLVRHQSGSDPAAVAFDGMKAAQARDVDIVIVDTAGRLHTRENLMEELRKVSRVIGKAIPGAPHEVLLVLDATTGQNALSQAKVFSSAIGVTGIVLTKLDGTAKGGAALAVRDELGVPIRYVGVGEGVDDLRPFSARDFAAGLIGDGQPEPGSP